MRAKSVLLLMLALGCGLVASIGITQVMAKRNQKPAASTGDMDAIFVAMEDIASGDPISAQMVKLEEWPNDKVPPGALTKIEDVENRRPKSIIYQGSPILENQLRSEGVGDGATRFIPKGYRVVPVRVDSVSGGSSMILPGDRVDVLVYLRRGQDIQQTSTRTILQDVKVFAVDDWFDIETSDDSTKSAHTISLLVTPGQAETLMLASELGSVKLVMRAPGDDVEVTTDGAQPAELFGLSEAGNRDEEDLAGRPQPGAGLGENPDLLQLLQSQSNQPGVQPGAVVQLDAPPKDSWTVRIIAGSEVNDVLLESDSDPSATEEESSGGFSLWRLISAATGGSGSATQEAPAEANPLAEDEEQEEEAVEAEEQEDSEGDG